MPPTLLAEESVFAAAGRIQGHVSGDCSSSVRAGERNMVSGQIFGPVLTLSHTGTNGDLGYREAPQNGK